MAKGLKNIKGMVDLLPQDSPLWQHIEAKINHVLSSFGYQEIRLPIVEYTDLFKRSIGEVTDIVEKEMYTFEDRNEESLTLRPEGTASCVRAAMQHAMLDNSQVQRLWYQGPMFRYERPQKGRQRQFHQVGVETFNMAGAQVDAELILLSHKLWRSLGVDSHVRLELNTIGSLADRNRYKADLVAYLSAHKDQLDDDSQRRLDTNPLRILDSKADATQALLDNAPNLHDYLSEESLKHFSFLKAMLDKAEIPYTVNPRLVRGLDYYNDTVFEWITDALGAQGTVCGGGRYDGLVEQLGGKPVPAFGFALGMERLALLLLETGAFLQERQQADIYAAVVCEPEDYVTAFGWLNQLREQYPNLRLMTDCSSGSFKSQLKKADKSGATYALVIGSNELESETVNLKPLRDDAEQKTVPLSELSDTVRQLFFE